MGILEVVFLVFLTLKLLGKLDKSWWFVFSPVIIGAVIYLVLFLGMILFLSRAHL